MLGISQEITIFLERASQCTSHLRLQGLRMIKLFGLFAVSMESDSRVCTHELRFLPHYCTKVHHEAQ